jgi:hypothetical protein
LVREEFAANALSVCAQQGFEDEKEGGPLTAPHFICSSAHLQPFYIQPNAVLKKKMTKSFSYKYVIL